uniref:NADH-ubiquinone oxidoreductase chain 5 n=1 Tax=Notonecta chinensis TaxID=642072 RepID=A0A343A059_9HEMI|nr:NADH dehydrogenase subunit 5 [Notonecta chinensis]AOW68980.1 NADH dehydrogenase subunit 5 [Notonecta chinensis]
MLKISLYNLSFIILFLLASLFGMIGIYFLMIDYMIFVDWEFLSLNSCSMTMTLLFDWMSFIFMSCVLFISSMVIFYSQSYMSSDVNSVRFLILVLLFVFSMVMMIISPNLISILIGWDGLGLVSYCLVIYFQNYKSYNAGMLTILTNRIGDVAILLSIAWMLNFGSWHYIYYTCIWEGWMFYFICFLVLAGFTKSAQIPFSSWLPAAMAAPTPVSALVHSSTLVTAGVYLLIRFSSLFDNIDCYFLVLISMMTMFMSGLGASFEYDLKKIIALSTLSQLGLMMSILFLGFPLLAFFHLLTHAFFKALLFLCAGLIIHCMSDSQDIRHMGGVVNYLPFTCSCFCISSLSLCGLPFLSGFYSKDMILEVYVMSGYNFFLYLIFFVSVGLTVAYSTRLVYYCMSEGCNMYVCQSYFEDKKMIISMIFLTLMSIISGSILCWFIFMTPSLIVLPFLLKMMPLFFIILGGWLGYELSFYSLNFISFSYLYYQVSYFMGSMWFMPKFSTYMMYNNSLLLSKSFSENVDMGWGEHIISNSSLLFFSFISKLSYYYSNNNVKLFMFSFFFILFMMII